MLFIYVLSDDQVVMGQAFHPIPFRTRLKAVAPMVLSWARERRYWSSRLHVEYLAGYEIGAFWGAFFAEQH